MLLHVAQTIENNFDCRSYRTNLAFSVFEFYDATKAAKKGINQEIFRPESFFNDAGISTAGRFCRCWV